MSLKRQRMASSAEDMKKPILPHELIYEILSYLPVISLLRFKTVCKLWRDTIEDPIFIEKHLNQARFAITCHSDSGALSSLGTSTTTAESSIVLCFLHGLQLEKCNSTNTYSIKNPSTKQALILPPPKNSTLIMTMCFISTSHKYKVVYLYVDELTNDRLGCEALTIGTDSSWRPMDIPETSYNLEVDNLKDNILINRVLYVVKESKYGGSDLICIDVEKEQFVQVNIPRNLFSDCENLWPLRWNGEMISIVNVVDHRLHVWILEDFKKKKWGKKKIDIPLPFLEDFPNSKENLYIRAVADDILLFAMNAEQVIVLYSIRSASVKHKVSVPTGVRMMFGNRSSLVSLSGMLPLG